MIIRQLLISCALLLTASTVHAQSTSLDFDQERSKITFTSTAPAEKIVGTASKVAGTVKIDLESLNGKGVLEFPVDSMNTGNNLRDRHLKSKDWLNAKENPTIRFEVSSIENARDIVRKGDSVEFTGTAVGQVSVNGVGAPAKAEVKVKLDTSKKIARVETTFKVKLADHKVEGKKGVVGDKVGETIDISGLLYAKVSL